MKLVYVAGPYRSKTIHGIAQNIRAAEQVALKYWQKGYAVICPHKNTAFLDGACADEVWLTGDLEMVKRCDALVAMSNWEDSTGAMAEVAYAISQGVEVIYDGEALGEVVS